MKEIIDGEGNSITFDGRKLWLKLKGRSESRNVGWYESMGGGEFHTLRNTTQKFGTIGERGFGFNWHLLKEAKFRLVVVHHDHKIYWAEVKDVLAGGKCVKYSRQGFELQIIYPLNKFQAYDRTGTQGKVVPEGSEDWHAHDTQATQEGARPDDVLLGDTERQDEMRDLWTDPQLDGESLIQAWSR